MSTLVCVGLGYCARHYVAEFGQRFTRIVGTTRSVENATALAKRRFGKAGVEMLVFDGKSAPVDVASAIRAADALLISAAPTEQGDSLLTMFGEELLRAPALKSVVFLSSTGVYPDTGGDWVDETTTVHPHRRSDRIHAEHAWQAFGRQQGAAVAILRLGGIYGPGQNAFTRLLADRAYRIEKPGHVSNRIHVADIVQAIDAAFARRADGIFNVVDDEPAPPSDQITFAAGLLGIDPPSEIPFAEAQQTMSPFVLSFYSGCARVRNDRLKSELGVALRYPNYRAGLSALYEAGDHLVGRG
jgi:nucleoside-diphosphate-sugar epimerase